MQPTRVPGAARRLSSIRTQLMLSMGAMLALALAMAVINYWNLLNVQASVQATLREASLARELSLELENEFLLARQNEADLMSSERELGFAAAAGYVTANQRHVAQARLRLNELRQLVQLAQDQALRSVLLDIDRFEPQLDAYEAAFQASVAAMQERGQPGGLQSTLRSEWQQLESLVAALPDQRLHVCVVQLHADEQAYFSTSRQEYYDNVRLGVDRLVVLVEASSSELAVTGTSQAELVSHAQAYLASFNQLFELDQRIRTNSTVFREVTADVNQITAHIGEQAEAGLERARVQLQATAARGTLVSLVAAVLTLGLGGLTAAALARRIVGPLNQLGQAAQRLGQGSLDRPVSVAGSRELAALSDAFNRMAQQLQRMLLGLEQQVAERTAELARRVSQLDLINRVGREATSVLYLDALLSHVADMICATFGYYAVLIWLVDEPGGQVCLQAAATAEPANLLETGLRVPLASQTVVGQAVSTGEPLVANDVKAEPLYQADRRLPHTRAELALPLRVVGQALGVLDLHSAEAGAFMPDEVLVLQTLADQIAVAIRNAQLYRTEQARRQLAESLEQAGRELSSSLDLHEVPARVLQQLASLVPYERASVMLQDGEYLRIVAQRGFPHEERVPELRVPIRPGDVFQQVVQAGRPLVVDNVGQELGWQQVDWLPLNLSWMGVPLFSKDRVIGMISLTRRPAAAFSQDDIMLAATFTAPASIALENASLYDQIKRFNEQLEHVVQSRTAELNKAYQSLSKLDKAKTDFIEVAAHELRTPLAVIKGYAQLLEAMPAVVQDPDIEPCLRGILDGADRLHEIFDSMLDVTRIDGHMLDVQRERTNLVEVVQCVLVGFEPALRERRLTLTTSGLEGLPLIRADAHLLRKVFNHLIANAIKYTPDGGSITVDGRVIAGQAGAAVEIVVSDTGIGIDPAYHELIFEKFYQTGEVAMHSSGRTKFKGGGPGLGLAIARGIVLAHDGQIWVESEGCDEARCPGSRFHVRLPLGA